MTEGLFTVFRRKSKPDLEQDKAIRLREGTCGDPRRPHRRGFGFHAVAAGQLLGQ